MFFMFIIGFVILLLGILLFIDMNKKMDSWVKVEGEVTNQRLKVIRDIETNERTFLYCEDIRFFVNNREITATSTFCSIFPYSVGKRVEIIYNPNNMTDIIIKTFSRTYLIPVALILLSSIILISIF